MYDPDMAKFFNSIDLSSIANFPGLTSMECQYPSEWFTEHKQKPTIKISLTTEDLQTSRGFVKSGLKNGRLQKAHAKTFLYYYGLTLKGTIDEDWASYGVSIASKGSIVTPWNLINIQTEQETMGGDTVASDDQDNKWMAMYLLSLHRLSKIQESTYLDQIIKRVDKLLDSAPGKNERIASAKHLSHVFVTDPEYKCMVAAFDMFFFRFPSHPDANLRIGTIVSRYQDCAALTSCRDIMDFLGLTKTEEVSDWIVLKMIQEDFDRMFKGNEETESPYSYFPYQIDLGIVKRSAYSSVANRKFFFFIHSVGAMMGLERSKNAKYPARFSTLTAETLIENAKVMAYFFKLKFKSEDGKELPKTTDEDVDDMKFKDALECYLYLKGNNFVLPPATAMFKFITFAIQNIKNPRYGTIGKFLQEKVL